MKIENLLNKPLWQMTGEEFMFLSKSATSDSAPRQPEVTVDASLLNMYMVYLVSLSCSVAASRQPTVSRKAVESTRR